MKRFSVTTLGCKVNQCESAALKSLLTTQTSVAEADPAQSDIIVINTCTVTSKAAMQSRQAIRRAIRENPKARVVVTGCYAQTAPQQIQNIEGVDLIVGHADKLRIAEFIAPKPKESVSPRLIHHPVDHITQFDTMPTVAPESRTRAFLKIQDGCNAFCTYCIVPHARGRSRSMPSADVADHINKLVSNGFQEVVLTGIHLGMYGKDLDSATTLEALLSHLFRHTDMKRMRISSIEPTEIDRTLIDLMADPQSPLCPHLHIPLQSGDNQVLKRMGRPYTRELFAEVLQTVRQIIPHAAIGVDVMVGFPGEDDAAFDQSYDLIQSLPVTYLHVFPFSPRQGTPAEKFSDRIPDTLVKERSRRLRRLGEAKKMEFFHSQIGRSTDVLIESSHDSNTGYARGLSENYIPISIPDAEVVENIIVKAQIMEVKTSEVVIGKLLS